MVEKKHHVQIEVIKEMKKQLEDLENHIYNNKDEFDLPESFVDVFRERQNNIISKLKTHCCKFIVLSKTVFNLL